MATFTPTNLLAKNSVSSGFQEVINSTSVLRPTVIDCWKKVAGYCKLWFIASYPTALYTDPSIDHPMVKQMKTLFGGGGKSSPVLSSLLSNYF